MGTLRSAVYLSTSDAPGDICSCSFTGNSVEVIAPKEPGAGRIEVQIDGIKQAIADLSTIGKRQSQQVVCNVTNLNQGKHIINIINSEFGPVAVDAILVK